MVCIISQTFWRVKHYFILCGHITGVHEFLQQSLFFNFRNYIGNMGTFKWEVENSYPDSSNWVRIYFLRSKLHLQWSLTPLFCPLGFSLKALNYSHYPLETIFSGFTSPSWALCHNSCCLAYFPPIYLSCLLSPTM